MANEMHTFLPDMGQYAAYIWASYGLAAALIIGLLFSSLQGLRQAQAALNRLQSGTQAANGQGAEDK